MKFVKAIVIIVVVLVLVVVGVSLPLPSKVHVERSIVIGASAQEIFDRVNDLKQWDEWSPWHAMEPDATYEYSGPEAGVGAKSVWKGEKVGEGSQEITLSEPYSRIETRLEFKDQAHPAAAAWLFEEEEGTTKVTWSFDGDMGKNPIGKIFGLLMDSMLGPQYVEGLEKLKDVCEATAAPSAPSTGMEDGEIGMTEDVETTPIEGEQ